MSKRRIRLDLSYDGTDFAGYQIQNDWRTCQGELELALLKLTGKKVGVVAAGRTDSGVHAHLQVVHFDIKNCSIPSDRFSLALNARLPHDIRILRSYEVPPTFHARYSAVSRSYKYYIYDRGTAPAHLNRYCLSVHRKLSVEKLNRYASLLVGTHDFSSFSLVRDANDNKVRTVDSCSFYEEYPFIVFHIRSKSFLWKMVRSIVGTILELYFSQKPPQELLTILSALDRKKGGKSAPAKGLFLHHVAYLEDNDGSC